MKKYLSYVITAAVLIVLGLFFKLALMGYSFLAYALFAAAAVVLAYMVLKIFSVKHEAAARRMNKVITYCLILFLVALAITEVCLINEAANANGGEARYAVVLGAGVNGTRPSRSLRARLEAARDYAEKYPDCVIIVSGSQGPNEEISEAQSMYSWLTEHGIGPERVVIEDKADNTTENLKFSREIIAERDPDFSGTVCIVTETYHVMRAEIMALDNGFESTTAVAGYTGLPILTANYFLREAIALWYYMLIR